MQHDDAAFFREAGHRLVDQLADYLERAEAGTIPVLPNLPPLATAQAMQRPMPAEGRPDLDALERAFARVIEGSNHFHHPGYLGHQVCPPLLVSALGELVSGVLNQSMAVYEMGPAATQIERQTVRWLCDAVGWPAESDGIFTSGGSLGNLTALLVARNMASRAWDDGITEPLAIAVSEQAHYSVARAAQILGLGAEGCIAVPADARFGMRMNALRERVANAPRRVIAVVGSACTTATGSFDSLREIGEFCREQKLWFHVDGAHGASLLLSETHRATVDGIELADSIVWDAHKMLSVPGLSTAVLFRRGDDNFRAFETAASYLFGRSRDEAHFDVGLRTIECTKRMLAWKLWIALQWVGRDGLAARIDALIERARGFAQHVRTQSDFELLTEPQCNIVVFRHRATEDPSALRQAVNERGHFYLVQTRIGDRTWLRCTFMNPRTSAEHARALLDEIRAVAGNSEEKGSVE